MPCRPRHGLGTALSIVAAAGMLLTGCAHQAVLAPMETAPVQRHASVAGSTILAQDAARMALAANQVVIPGELSNPEVVPAYPPELLALGLPDQTVCVGFVIGTDGSVSSLAPVYGSDKGCPASPDQTRPEFVAATLEAVSRWDYFSYLRCTFPPGTPDAQKCNGPGASAEQVAVSVAHRFLFSVREGLGSVQQAQ